MAQIIPEAIREWLSKERAWKPGLDPNGCTTLAFTPLPENRSQLVTLGLPNNPEEVQVPAVFTDCQLRLDKGPWELLIGRVYVVRGQVVRGGMLILPPQSPNAVVAQVVNGMEDAATWAELFAGLGSWSWAAQRMGLDVSIAVELDKVVSETFCHNHPTIPCFQGEVANFEWIPDISEPLQGVAASPPCPAFSSLQQAPGFKAASAAPWTQLMTIIRTLQVPMVLIENVAGVQKRLPEVMEAFRLCGYRLMATQLVDLADLTATKRERWFGLFVRQHVQARSPMASAVFKRHAHNLTSFEAILPPDWPKDHLDIPPEGLEALRNPDYVKYAKNAGQAWIKHLVHEYQQVPTITHQYGNAWNLPEHTLLKGGLHCPIFCPRNTPQLVRMFSPWEIARLHALPHTLVLPEDLLTCWQILGNGVSPAQCTVGFGLVLSLLGKATFKSVCKTVEGIIQDTVTFQGRRPVFQGGWQRLEMWQESTPKVPNTLPEISSSPDWASDDSARCFCSDDTALIPPRGTSPLPRNLNADYDAMVSDSEQPNSPVASPNTQELTRDEWDEHSALFAKLDALEQRRAPVNLQEVQDQTRKGISTVVAQSHDKELPPTIKWHPAGYGTENCETQGSASSSLAMAPKTSKRPQGTPSPAEPETPATNSPVTPDEAFDRERSPLQRRKPQGPTPPVPPSPRSSGGSRQRRHALEQSQQALEGLRSIQVREEDGEEASVVKLHSSNPLAILKLLAVTDDASVQRKIEFRHVNLASHTLAYALPMAPWVLLSTERYNKHGEQRAFRLERDLVVDLARLPFITEDATCPFGLNEATTIPLVRTRQPFDSWTLLPDGRSIFIRFNNEVKNTANIKDHLFSKFPRQFAGGDFTLWSPCQCRTHWRQLQDEELHEPGSDLSSIALPSSLGGVLTGLIPELLGADAMVDLRAVPRRAVRTGQDSRGSMRPPEPVGPPPHHIRRDKPSVRPREPPGPPPRRILEQQAKHKAVAVTATNLTSKASSPCPLIKSSTATAPKEPKTNPRMLVKKPKIEAEDREP